MTTARAQVRDIEVRSADGVMLRGRWWQRPGPRGVVVVSHGYGEHGGAYGRVAEALGTTLDMDVVAVDFRGHGRSPGRRGVVRRYDDLTADLSSVMGWVGRQKLAPHRFLLGHSNGGQVALRMVLEKPVEIDGLIVSNPALKIAVPIPPSKIRLGRLLLRFAPGLTLGSEIRTDRLTRDPLMQQEHRTDPLRHNRMSAPLFFGMVEGGEALIARAGEIRTPTLMLIGGQDPVVDPVAARDFFDRLGSEDKTLHFYPKMLHEPLNELGREQVVDDLVRWIEPRLSE